MRQTWLKDVGWHEAPGYREHLGLAELADFLEVAGARLDYVKLLPAQIINAPRAWLERKIATYHGNAVATYFDHTYFLAAYRHGTVGRAGDRPGRRAEAGVRAIATYHGNGVATYFDHTFPRRLPPRHRRAGSPWPASLGYGPSSS